MKKGITKDKICISLDKKLHDSIKEHCDKNMIKLSTYIEYLIKKGLGK
jgi:hypothetical protein